MIKKASTRIFYRVEFWDEDKGVVEDFGLAFGDNILQNIQSYYGEENIMKITVSWAEDSFVMSKDDIDCCFERLKS